MVSWLLAAPIDTGDTLLEELIAGLEVTAIGMSVVFGVLILLFAVMVVIGRVFAETPAAPAMQTSTTAEGDAPDAGELLLPDALAVEEPQELGLTPAADSAPDQLAAVIAAALAAVMISDAAAAGSARADRFQTAAGPRSQRAGWALAGRIERLTARERMPYSPRGR